jgi:hypothetical protein
MAHETMPDRAGANGGYACRWQSQTNSRLRFFAPWLSFGSLGHIRTMKRLRSFLLAILIFGVGLACGGALSAFFYIRWIDTYMTSDSFVGISDRFMVLRALRAGDTNEAIDTLEEQMNGQILGFAGMRKDVPLAKLKPADIRLITRVRDYRVVHPYSEDPQLDPVIASILSLTNKTMWPNTALERTPTAP